MDFLEDGDRFDDVGIIELGCKVLEAVVGGGRGGGEVAFMVEGCGWGFASEAGLTEERVDVGVVDGAGEVGVEGVSEWGD